MITSRDFHGGTEANHGKFVRITCVRAEIQKQRLPNTGQEDCRNAKLLGVTRHLSPLVKRILFLMQGNIQNERGENSSNHSAMKFTVFGTWRYVVW
jgi:hypothetical protein